MHSSTQLTFRKSSYSSTNRDCVEVADLPGASAVRDTQNRDAGHLTFASQEWAAMLSTARTER
ncbi:DUF397 domain-containing protein [Nocardiopsis sp. NPDC007018]|uniref:DUF397 domain-containing protein n=1 Tax=Nocardiopsis sp. NPDC007018 TaxID=3155721 RepID=UPI0034090BD0